MTEFKEFPKITRFYEQDICITEKIDGTNGIIWISDDLQTMRFGSRSRWVTPEADNYGFAKWCEENREELKRLGAGFHYGEWWGQGIQRKYSMPRKVFSLFNVNKWTDDDARPSCCDVVPILYQGLITPKVINDFSKPMTISIAAKKYGIEFDNAEGTMMYLTKAGIYLKAPNEKGHK